MSLAVVVDVGQKDVNRKFTAAIGLLLSTALAVAAVEQAAADGAGRWWLPLSCALACAGWCRHLCRRRGRQRPLRLQVTTEGTLRLLCTASGEATDAVVLHAWGLGHLIFLQIGARMKVDPQTAAADDGQSASVFGSAGCLFVLARGSFDERHWHALRRWLVWYRRSRRSEDVAA